MRNKKANMTPEQLYQKAYREANKKKKSKVNKAYRKKHLKKAKAYQKQYYIDNKEAILKVTTQYHIDNRDKRLIQQSEYREVNKTILNEKKKDANKEYRKKNKVKINEHSKVYQKNLKLSNPLFKLKANIRTLISNSLRKKGYTKTTKSYLILGCSFEKFINHIESQWSSQHNLNEDGKIWMNWDNYGTPKDGIYKINKTWDIDHIKPLSSALNESDILSLNNYLNLQPLCSYNNRFIKKRLFLSK